MTSLEVLIQFGAQIHDDNITSNMYGVTTYPGYHTQSGFYNVLLNSAEYYCKILYVEQ